MNTLAILTAKLAELNRKTLALRDEQDDALATGNTALVRYIDREMFDLDMQGEAIQERIDQLEREANELCAPVKYAARRRVLALIGA